MMLRMNSWYVLLSLFIKRTCKEFEVDQAASGGIAVVDTKLLSLLRFKILELKPCRAADISLFPLDHFHSIDMGAVRQSRRAPGVLCTIMLYLRTTMPVIFPAL